MENELLFLVRAVYMRIMELVFAPLDNQDMLWTAIPLLIATLFMTLYFGRNRWEELGWNTAFGNTMVFLFVAMNIIRTMYNYGGSWESVIDNRLYLLISLGLAGASGLLMFLTYFHLMPKRLAFFILSAAPINVSVYVVMSIVYAGVPPDFITILAGIVFLWGILITGALLNLLMAVLGLAEPDPEKTAREVKKIAKGMQREVVEQEKKADAKKEH